MRAAVVCGFLCVLGAGSAFAQADVPEEAVALHRFLYKSGQKAEHIYTLDVNEFQRSATPRAYTHQGMIGYAAPKERPGTKRLLRYYNKHTGVRYFMLRLRTPNQSLVPSGLDAWVWTHADEDLVPIYGSCNPDGSNMLLALTRKEVETYDRDFLTVTAIKRKSLGIVFYLQPPRDDDQAAGQAD